MLEFCKLIVDTAIWVTQQSSGNKYSNSQQQQQQQQQQFQLLATYS